MDPSQTQATPETARGKTRGPERPEREAKGEPKSFDPNAAWREHQAEPTGAAYAQAPDPDAKQATSEAATTLREAADAFTTLQLAAGRWADDMLWRSTSWWALPSLLPAHPLKGMGLPLRGLPPVDIRETDKAYLLCVELPGLTLADVEVKYRGDVITISGEKLEETETERPTYHVSERRFGHFDRSFPIPADVERERITTRFRDGVLQVELPKAAPRA